MVCHRKWSAPKDGLCRGFLYSPDYMGIMPNQVGRKILDETRTSGSHISVQRSIILHQQEAISAGQIHTSQQSSSIHRQ